MPRLGSGRFIVFGAPDIRDAEVREAVGCLRGGWIGTGPRVARFEKDFGRYTGARHAVAVSSGTAALHLSMLASGVGPGDEVITTPLTFGATANAIMHAGARPRFVDVDRVTQNMDPALVAGAVNRRTRALLPVHLAGRPCDLAPLLSIRRQRGLVLVEDAAHAIEARYGGRRIGTIGDLTCFSFYVTKNLTCAEGGMVTSRRLDLARRIKVLAMHGMTHDAWARFSDRGFRHYRIVEPGYKYNLIDLHAALGIHQLRRIERARRRRLEIWRYYNRRLAGLPVFLPSPDVPGGRHALHLYTVHLDLGRLKISRDECIRALYSKGVGTGVHYVSLHLHPFYRKHLGLSPADFPNARWISERTLSLPLSAGLPDRAVARVADAFCGILRRAAKARN